MEVKDNTGGTRFIINSITFNRANSNWVINGQEYRQFIEDRYISEPEIEKENNLEIPLINIR